MIDQELQQLSTSPRALRKFGLLVGGVFVLLGGWFLFRHKPVWPYLFAPGALLVVLGLLAPRWLKGVYLAWMRMALALGLVVTAVILTLFFYLVVTPIGLAARLCGKDFLSRKIDPQTQSYWLLRNRSGAGEQPADYERQY